MDPNVTETSTSNNFDLKLEGYKSQATVTISQCDGFLIKAFNPKIASWAVENGRFGGPDYNPNRMTWIKTNFLWMMYRSNWATSNNQERILAIHLSREGFLAILRQAYTGNTQKQAGLSKVQVRLQWDPDHTPSGGKEERRAIQLGIRDTALEQFNKTWIRNIQDITEFVEQQREFAIKGDLDSLVTPKEEVFQIEDEEVYHQLEMHE